MSELVDEVEHQSGDAILCQVGRQALEQPLAVGGGEHLFVVHRYRSAGQLPHVLGQELGFVGVEAGILVIVPPLG